MGNAAIDSQSSENGRQWNGRCETAIHRAELWRKSHKVVIFACNRRARKQGACETRRHLIFTYPLAERGKHVACMRITIGVCVHACSFRFMFSSALAVAVLVVVTGTVANR